MNRRIDIVPAIQSQIAITVHLIFVYIFSSWLDENDFTDPFETIRICVQEHTDIYWLK